MHVLIVPSERYGDPDQPLGGIFQRDQARALREAGVQVGILAPEPRSLRHVKHPPRRIRGVSTWDEGGVRVVRFEGLNFATGFLQPLYRHLWYRIAESLLGRYIAACGLPDLIHAHNLSEAGVWAARSRRRGSIPYVVTEHSSLFLADDMPAWHRRAGREAVLKARQLFAVSTRLGERVRSVLEVDAGCVTIPNVLPEEFELAPAPDSRGSDAKGFHYLCVAGLTPVKNHRLMLEAFSRVAPDFPDTILELAGDGPLRVELERETAGLGLSGRVIFHGRLSRPGVLELIRRCHAVILPSRFETFGVALLEGLSAGRPVIATKGSGPDDFIDDSNGILVPPGDTAALAAAMAALRARIAHYSASSIRAACIRRFGRAGVSGLLIREYSRVLNSPMPRKSNH